MSASTSRQRRTNAPFDAEFHHDDVNSFTSLLRADRPVGRLHEATGGDLTRAVRHRTLLGPLDVADEMRIALRSRDTCWGTICLYRAGPAAPFSPHDEQLAARAAGVIADLLRLAMLRVALDLPHTLERPPGLLIVTPAGEPIVTTAAADAWLDSIDDRQRCRRSCARWLRPQRPATRWPGHAPRLRRTVGRFHGSALLDPDPADRLAIVVEEAWPIEQQVTRRRTA